MVQYCCAYNCNSHSDDNLKNPMAEKIKFHLLPLKDADRLKKWIHALKRKHFNATKTTLICSRHFKESDYRPALVSGKKILKDDAVPSIFDYPEHLIPKISTRRVLPPRDYIAEAEIQDSNVDGSDHSDQLAVSAVKKTYCDVSVQTNLTGEGLQKTLEDLRNDKKRLQMKLNRLNARVSNMQELVALLQKNNFGDRDTLDGLKANFNNSFPFECI